jgi:hypothetical protein
MQAHGASALEQKGALDLGTSAVRRLTKDALAYRRQGSRFWQCAIFLEGRAHRASTRQDRLALALEIAREWTLDRLAEARVRQAWPGNFGGEAGGRFPKAASAATAREGDRIRWRATSRVLGLQLSQLRYPRGLASL